MDVGDFVIDSDDPDPDLAVVVHRPDATIAERAVHVDGEERTVAEDNPSYRADDPAVVVAFVGSGLNSQWPEWTETEPADLHDGARANDVPLYTFPESRLAVLDDREVAARLDESTVDMAALRARLENAEWRVEVEESTLVAEKLGEQYRIHRTGDIEGEGEVRTPLENIVQQYTE